MTQKLPWEITAQEFGRSFVPVRTIGLANHPEWRYLEKLPARDARAKAVADAHRHFVERALEEGVAVPGHIAALYRPPAPPAQATAPVRASTCDAATSGTCPTVAESGFRPPSWATRRTVASENFTKCGQPHRTPP